ncbi:hypothetical protein A11A3_06221 [Alcanivorax hongdengensis A-11-3]|uniref:Lipoprotein n=1 Tax=Alcanivorax hongdengensis A-11-3 TaxID=1177179 RepID=L0WFV3_9GAMM|nr:hypothetical protein [Alcanivorax hongdengensis]EKF75027.1 hypothetical protein A11A3_06221 [Alcanivorax hongdengensis A-11-3]
MRIFLLALLLAGCASTTDVTTRYQQTPDDSPVQRLLLVAHTPESNVRETWELTCKDIFANRQLTVLLSHQELPLWYEGGKQRILDWAKTHDVQRVLVVELTHLLIDAAAPPAAGNNLNPMDNNADNLQPTWQIGIGGDLKKDTLPDALREHGAELFDGNGDPLWTGVTVTHEASELTAISKSQCSALKKTLEKQGYL